MIAVVTLYYQEESLWLSRRPLLLSVDGPTVSTKTSTKTALHERPHHGQSSATDRSYSHLRTSAAEIKQQQQLQQPVSSLLSPPFELYADFDMSASITTGHETWFDLVRYRRDATWPSLSFYVDKVARRREFANTNPKNNVPAPRAFACQYKSELTVTGNKADEHAAILQLLPPLGVDFAAKPTHLSCSGGVWLTKHEASSNTTYIGNGKQKMKAVDDRFGLHQVAASLTDSLYTVQELCAGKIPESWALQHVRPGILVDERFTSWNDDKSGDDDNRGGMEFKVFTIWGKAWMIVYRPGYDHVGGFFYPNGTAMNWRPTNNGSGGSSSDPVPDWLDWSRLVALGEQLGAHKDMFRTDIFVGIPARKRAQLLADTKNSSTAPSRQDWENAVEMAVSETEIHPTPYGKETNEVFEEGARLWLAGYRMGHYRVVPNTEVPADFKTI